MELTQIEKLLIYGLNLTDLPEEDQEAIFLFLEEEDDQILMIHYLKTHPNATPQEIRNESGRLLRQRKNLKKLYSEGEN